MNRYNYPLNPVNKKDPMGLKPVAFTTNGIFTQDDAKQKKGNGGWQTENDVAELLIGYGKYDFVHFNYYYRPVNSSNIDLFNGKGALSNVENDAWAFANVLEPWLYHGDINPAARLMKAALKMVTPSKEGIGPAAGAQAGDYQFIPAPPTPVPGAPEVVYGFSFGGRIVRDLLRIVAAKSPALLPKRLILMSPAVNNTEIAALKAKLGGMTEILVIGGSKYANDALVSGYGHRYNSSNVRGMSMLGKDVSHGNLGDKIKLYNQDWGIKESGKGLRQYRLYHNSKDLYGEFADVGQTPTPPSPMEQINYWVEHGRFLSEDNPSFQNK